MNAGSVLITGTTSGVGLCLLEHYAQSGVRVLAVNRRRVPELEARYPAVRFECVDVRVAADVSELLERLSAAAELPDVFILNAGINRADNAGAFDLAAYSDVLSTNLFGVLHFVQPLTRLPGGERPRHVVAVSSMAAYVGNPYGLGYATSKRALTDCFEVWSRMYAESQLVFQQVMLGPVRTTMFTMSEKFPAWMNALKRVSAASVAGTAHAIARFALTRRRKLFHPWWAVPLFLGMWLGRALVPGFLSGRPAHAERGPQ